MNWYKKAQSIQPVEHNDKLQELTKNLESQFAAVITVEQLNLEEIFLELNK